jgi:A/G-specific adenine glycosylase
MIKTAGMMKNQFTILLLSWHRKSNKRQMPWKGEKDPYKIWLSEVILQQTRVGQGWNYYERFITAYPDINRLASAKDEDVFKLWEGLGYYNRCKNLLFTARQITRDRQGRFPETYDEMVMLKGIGPYTAAAIASFAFNLPYAVVDGNVFRVLSRVFNRETAIDSTEGKKNLPGLPMSFWMIKTLVNTTRLSWILARWSVSLSPRYAVPAPYKKSVLPIGKEK